VRLFTSIRFLKGAVIVDLFFDSVPIPSGSLRESNALKEAYMGI